MKKKWMIVLLIVIAVAVGGGYFWYQKSHAPQKDNYTVGAVSRATIGLTIDATGTIEPVNSVDLSATASGTLEKVYVKQNEKVTKGETLAMIESKALTSMMKQTQNRSPIRSPTMNVWQAFMRKARSRIRRWIMRAWTI